MNMNRRLVDIHQTYLHQVSNKLRPHRPAIQMLENEKLQVSSLHCSHFISCLFEFLHLVADDTDEVDNAGLYKDVNVINIDSGEEGKGSKNADRKRDLDAFFDAPLPRAGASGGKTQRRCKTCW